MPYAPSREPHVFVPGSLVGSWRIIERYDSGSFGAVYRVEREGQPEAGPFALKIALHSEDPRFPREVELLQRVVHPSVPRFEDRGSWTGSDGQSYPYVVMEWVQGRLLYEWARMHSPTSREVLQVLAQLASALAAVHAIGGVHRDVKGDNILVTPEGRAVLLDWGAGTYEGAKALTDTALPPGTSSYRAPEAVRWAWAHRKTDEPYLAGPPDDVYALGATAYRLCTGLYPPAPEEGSVPQRRLIPPRELATVSVSLERLLLACLSQDRRARPPAATLATGLLAAAEEREATRPIVLVPAASDTEGASDLGPRRQLAVPTWLSLASAAGVGGLLVAAALQLRSPHPAPEYGAVEEERRTPPLEAPDAGVGDLALAEAINVPRVGVLTYAVGLPMPKTPQPGQRRPPCDPDAEKVINGACWAGPIGTKKPPCGAIMFDHDDGCYMPSFNTPRKPTSEEPQ